MKASITFNLPEENEEYRIYMRAMDYSIFIEEFSNYLRRKYKHTMPEESKTAEQEYEEICKTFYEMKADRVIE